VGLWRRTLGEVVDIRDLQNLTLPDRLSVFRGQRVLITGNTGFKGSWLALWLQALGAEVSGYSLPPPTVPNLHELIRSVSNIEQTEGDVRDLGGLRRILGRVEPQVVFHMAAQPLVRRSYAEPVETAETNFIGTIKLLEAVRLERRPTAIVVVTTDKCYENSESTRGYCETDRLGGHDVYSMSKAAAELAVESYRRSFFPETGLEEHGIAIASARAGNVIGGGDWAEDRVVCDIVRALDRNEPVALRNPDAVRPWQHVLEPLSGYLHLAAGLLGRGEMPTGAYCSSWNFGPTRESCRTVQELVECFLAIWGGGSFEITAKDLRRHETKTLILSIEKATKQLKWSPRWGFRESVQRTAEWYRAYYNGEPHAVLVERCTKQIADYINGAEDQWPATQ